MAAGYLVPVTVKACPDPNKGQGVFAAAPVTKGTLLWQPNQVQAIPADEITSTLAAMPYENAQVSWQTPRPEQCLLKPCKLALVFPGVAAPVFCSSQ